MQAPTQDVKQVSNMEIREASRLETASDGVSMGIGMDWAIELDEITGLVPAQAEVTKLQ